MNTYFTLSRSELSLVGRLIQAQTIPGLTLNADASKAQRIQQLADAENSLRIRNLATINPEGNLLVARELLEMVATCAYPQASLLVHQASSSGTSRQLYGHVRDEWIVWHATPNPELHELQRMPDVPALIEDVLQASGYTRQTSTPAALLLQVSGEVLEQVQHAAAQGQGDVSRELLTAAGADADSAQYLTDLLLARPYTTTIFTALEYQAQAIAAREYTLLQASGAAVLMVRADTETLYQLQDIAYDELKAMLLHSLAAASVAA